MLLVFPEGAVYINKLKLTMRYLSSLAGLLCGYFNVLSEPWVGSQLRALSIQPPLAGGSYTTAGVSCLRLEARQLSSGHPCQTCPCRQTRCVPRSDRQGGLQLAGTYGH